MRKKVGISACLLGKDCRYNGGNCRIPELREENIDWVPVCPEELGGLSTPRPPAELTHPVVDILSTGQGILTQDGRDVTEAFIRGGDRSLEILRAEKVNTVILKSHSPSCGIGTIYDGSFSNQLTEGDGVFAKMCQDEGFDLIDSDDVESLKEKGYIRS